MESIANMLKTGDVLLFNHPSLDLERPWRGLLRAMIKRAGCSEWDHAAVVIRTEEDDTAYVLEHTHAGPQLVRV